MAKHLKTAPLIPTAGPSYRPALEQRRAMLTSARDQFRQKGYEAELNIEALKVQSQEEDGETTEQRVTDATNTAENAYKAARRMDELLSKLPTPKVKP